MEGLPPICVNCEHWNENSAHPVTCKAFPQGIPDEIFTYGNPHIEPINGDNGIQFEPRNGILTKYAKMAIDDYNEEKLKKVKRSIRKLKTK
jgi:hypothetical protein